jgi:hypothetical protein
MDAFRMDEKALSLARIACRAQIGLDAPLVQVEVSLGSGLPMFCIVGLPEIAVKEYADSGADSGTTGGAGEAGCRCFASSACPKQ